MRTILQGSLLLLALGAIGLAGPAGDPAADKKAAAERDRKEIDASIYRLFRHVINKGADQYNAGDTIGCYRLFEHALRTVLPLLGHRPELQATISASLADAAQEPRQHERAFVLRRAIDDLRAAVKPEASSEKAPSSNPKKSAEKPAEPKPAEPKKAEEKESMPKKEVKPAQPKKSDEKPTEPKEGEKSPEPRKLDKLKLKPTGVKKVEPRAG